MDKQFKIRQKWLDAVGAGDGEGKTMVRMISKRHARDCQCSACMFLDSHLFVVGIRPADSFENDKENDDAVQG